jgi:lysophospholipase L1-like esterase
MPRPIARWLAASIAVLGPVSACGHRENEAPQVAEDQGPGAPALLARNAAEADVLVVLGSSTAAGEGAGSPDAGWVARYRAYLAEKFPQLSVHNLAKGGFTTYEIQPASYVPPVGRPLPDPERNIDAALALAPRALVINLPSNDEAARYPWSEQLANYERVSAAARSAHVALWVTTTQPRNFEHAEQRDNLRRARSAIQQLFAPRVVDFYVPLAASGGRLKPELDCGDGTHVNAAGHALLAQAIIRAGLAEAVVPHGQTERAR